MTTLIQICGVLAVLAVPYALITLADKAMVKRAKAKANFAERKDKFVHRLNRRSF